MTGNFIRAVATKCEVTIYLYILIIIFIPKSLECADLSYHEPLDSEVTNLVL